MSQIKLLTGAILILVTSSASAQTLVGITNQAWKYYAVTGGDPGTNWAGPDYDDSEWPTGLGLFGNDFGYPYPFATSIIGPNGGGPLVAFFLTSFSWSGSPVGIVFTMTNYFDDGVVLYLNGGELTRFNMPAGVVDQNTVALGTLTEPVVRVHQLALDSLTNGNANPLVAGTNVLAASVHNTGAFSGDTVFGLSVSATLAVPPCTDPTQPTNRVVLEGRPTVFTLVQTAGCGVPAPTLQWYRNVGFGEEIIPGQTGASLTVTNARRIADEGEYYCRLVNSVGSVDCRRAVLMVQQDDVAPQFLRFRADPLPNVFHLVVDEPLCVDASTCGSDATSAINWRIVNISDPANDLRVAGVTINGTNVDFTTIADHVVGEFYKVVVDDFFGSAIGDVFGNFALTGLSITNEPEPTAISVGPAGSKLYTFDELPYAREFSTFLWRGGNDGRIDTITNIDAKVQLLDATNITQALIGIAGTPPPVFFGPARWASQGGYLTTRPTGTAGDVILGRLRNDSGVTKSAIIVSYDLTVEFPTIEEAPGYLVYYSLSGVPGSWVPVPGISGDGSTGHKVFILDLSATPWTAESFLYILWVDDNGSGEPDSAVELDHFRATFPCPLIPVSIIRSPTSVSTNEGTTVRFNIVAAGPAPLTYQWFKGGLPLSNGGNISGAMTAQLTIADTSLSDAGSYICRVSNVDCSLSADSAPATLTIVPDSTRPALANAMNTGGTTVTLTFSKAMSIATAQNTLNYVISPPITVSSAVRSVDGRTVTLTTATRTFPSRYRLTLSGLTDNRANANLINPNPTVVDLTSSIVASAYGDTWSYQTNNLDDQTWTLSAYDDSAWRVGRGFFGTEQSADVTNALPSPRILTVIPPNNDTANTNAFVTSYFRRQVTLPALTAGTAYILSHYTDDGAVFYLDGMEIGRYQMPAGTPTFVTRSTGGNVEAVLQTFFFSASPGLHTLAVEVHQAGDTSPDVVFGANISAVTLPRPLTIQSDGNTSYVQWFADSSWQLVGSQIVDGNYSPVPGVPLGYYSIPFLQTNQFFYRLRYSSQP